MCFPFPGYGDGAMACSKLGAVWLENSGIHLFQSTSFLNGRVSVISHPIPKKDVAVMYWKPIH